jgi:hypothetical protein
MMLETLAATVILGLIVIVVRVLGAGSDAILAELFPPSRQPGWPRGIQEEDVPRFAFDRAN